jgi:hypothetical protein
MAYRIFRLVLVDSVKKYIPFSTPYATRDEAETKRKEFERAFVGGPLHRPGQPHQVEVLEVDRAGTISSEQIINESFERKAAHR